MKRNNVWVVERFEGCEEGFGSWRPHASYIGFSEKDAERHLDDWWRSKSKGRFRLRKYEAAKEG